MKRLWWFRVNIIRLYVNKREEKPREKVKKRDEIKRYLRQTLPLQILWHTLNYLNSIWLAIAIFKNIFICLWIWIQKSSFFLIRTIIKAKKNSCHGNILNKTCLCCFQSYKQCHGNSLWHKPCQRNSLSYSNHATGILSVIQTMPQEFSQSFTGILSVIQTMPPWFTVTFSILQYFSLFTIRAEFFPEVPLHFTAIRNFLIFYNERKFLSV